MLSSLYRGLFTDVSEHHRRAYQYRKSGHLFTSLKEHDLAIAADPDYDKSWLFRGNIYYRLYLRESASHNPAKAQNYLQLAINDFQKSLELNPDNTSTYFKLGIICFKRGDIERAISNFTEIIKRDPENMKAFTFRGIAYYSKGKPNEALWDFVEAMKINPDKPLVHKYLRNIFVNYLNECNWYVLEKPIIKLLIMKLHNEIKIPVLYEVCFGRETRLAKRLWKTEFPFGGCKLTRGTVGELLDHLAEIDSKNFSDHVKDIVRTRSKLPLFAFDELDMLDKKLEKLKKIEVSESSSLEDQRGTLESGIDMPNVLSIRDNI